MTIARSSFHPAGASLEPPALALGLGEVCAEGSAGVAAALGFLLAAREGVDAAMGVGSGPVVLAAPRAWLAERGRLLAGALGGDGAFATGTGTAPALELVAVTRNETDALWALEEALRSGSAAFAIGAVEQASLLATRRLDLAARTHRARVALIKTAPTRELSAARQRWRVAPHPSAPHPWDPKASGAARWRVSLERSREALTGAWILEQDPETHRLRVAEGLADHRLDLGGAGPAPLRRSA